MYELQYLVVDVFSMPPHNVIQMYSEVLYIERYIDFHPIRFLRAPHHAN